MMVVVPKRPWILYALIPIIVVSLIMALSGSLNGAAAWANIIALPVAIIGVTLAMRRPSRSRPETAARDWNEPAGQAGPGGTARVVNQFGFPQRDNINVAGDYIVPVGRRRGEG